MDGDDRASRPSQDVPATPNENDSFGTPQVTTSGFVAVNHARNQKPDAPNGDIVDTTTPASNGKCNSQSAKTQSNLHAFLEPQNRRSSVGEVESMESKKDKPNNKAPALETILTEGNRKTRKSMPAKLKEAEGVENNPDQSQTTTPRPERKSKNAATEANAKLSKMSSRGPRSTPRNSEKTPKDQNNANIATPAHLTASSRRERESARKSQGGIANSTNATPLRSTARRRGGPREVNGSRDQEVPDGALQSTDSTQSDNDTELYVDGQTDSPASPKGANASAAARISRRNRKPTMRAMESFESEKRYRRRRGTSIRAESQSGEPNGTAHHPDLALVAQRLYELAVEAVSPTFKLTPDAKTQLAQLRKEYYAKKEQQNAPPASARKGKAAATAITSKPGVSKNKQISQPWKDEKGWTHTGFVNEHGEEYLLVPSDSELYRPNNTYGDSQLPLPPIRLKSREQLDKDRIFGFPPRMGERNLPQNGQLPFYYENVEEERARIQAREEARRLGLIVDRNMPTAEIRALITQHGPVKPPSPKETSKPVGQIRRRRRTQVANEDGSDYQPKQRRRRRPATAPGTPVQMPAPESPDKKSMKIKLKFGKGTGAVVNAEHVDNTDASVELIAGKSRKRGLSATEGGPEDVDENSTKRLKLSTSEVDNTVGAAAAPGDAEKVDETPASSFVGDHATQSIDQGSNDTPGRRPRRRATGTFSAESVTSV